MQTLYPRPDQKAELAVALSAQALCMAIPAPAADALRGRVGRSARSQAHHDGNGFCQRPGERAAGRAGRSRTPCICRCCSCCWCCTPVIGVFHNSAFDASYAMIVPEQKLGRANGMMQSDLVVVRHHLADDRGDHCGPARHCCARTEPPARSRNCPMARRWRWASTPSRFSSPRPR